MAILTFRVKGQTLTVESKINKIVENSVNYLDYEIIYDDEKWDSPLAKKVVITYDKKAYEIFGDKIPSQVIRAPGFTVSVVGYKSGSETDSGIIITTSPIAIKVFPSGAIEGTIPEDTAIDSSVAEQLNEKIEIQANEIKNNYLSINTAIAELEKGTIPAMDEVNVWELEAGVYYVNSTVFYAVPNPPSYPNSVVMQGEKGLLYVQVNESDNNTREFYLFANRNIYLGTSVCFGETRIYGTISNVIAIIRDKITGENGDGIPTAKAVYDCIKPLKTELLEKVNKSDILSNIDMNAEPKDIYNAPAVNTALAKLEKGTIPTMDKVNVWELEAGVYYVNDTVFYATPHPPVYLNCVEMQSEKGLLYVHIDISSNTARNFYLFANGNIYFGNSMPNAGAADGFGSISSVVADIRNEITRGSVDGIPTKNAVYNFGENIKTELLANIGNKADKTEVETALSGKVDKSDILTEIITDEVYTDNQFYNANAVNSLVTLFDKEFVAKNTFNTTMQEVANTFQTKVDKSNVLTAIDYDASADGIYNARVINSIIQQINETFATKAYVNEVIGGIENGSY